jgi:hypothetical protein
VGVVSVLWGDFESDGSPSSPPFPQSYVVTFTGNMVVNTPPDVLDVASSDQVNLLSSDQLQPIIVFAHLNGATSADS